MARGRIQVRGLPSKVPLPSGPRPRTERFHRFLGLRRFLGQGVLFAFVVGLVVSGGLVPISPVAAEERVAIELGDLPQPPDEILALIRAGRVSFEAGPRDPLAEPRNGPRTTAETRYRIVYNYRSRSTWKVDRANARLVIHVRYLQIEWKPTHTVWFLRSPPTSDFWSNRLVLHEFDHVRISTDPRLAARFEQLLRDQRVLHRTIDDEAVVNREYVDRLVGQHVDEVFSEISDLISIRYRELDRLTRHGLEAVPNDSPLQELLRSAVPDTE